MAYLDNIIIFSKNEEEHLKHIEDYFSETEGSRTQAQGIQVWFVQKREYTTWDT